MDLMPDAAARWNNAEVDRWANWWSSPRCLAYYNTQVCGRPLTGNSEGCRARLAEALNGRKLDLGVSVGCGGAAKELALLEDGLVDRFELWEIAPRYAEQGQREAERRGLGDRAKYRIGNAFREPASERYDLVYWDHSLHHMPDVFAALAWSVAALRPGGFIVINDYVGRNRLQFTNAEVALANDFVKRHGLGKAQPRSNIITRLRQWRRDPSEAPQSERIPAAVEKHLPGAELEPIGGLFLNMLGGRVAPRGDDTPLMEAFLAEDERAKAMGLYHFAFALWRKP